MSLHFLFQAAKDLLFHTAHADPISEPVGKCQDNPVGTFKSTASPIPSSIRAAQGALSVYTPQKLYPLNASVPVRLIIQEAFSVCRIEMFLRDTGCVYQADRTHQGTYMLTVKEPGVYLIRASLYHDLITESSEPFAVSECSILVTW